MFHPYVLQGIRATSPRHPSYVLLYAQASKLDQSYTSPKGIQASLRRNAMANAKKTIVEALGISASNVYGNVFVYKSDV